MTGRVSGRQRRETVDERLRRVLAVHFDRCAGTPFWIERARELEIDPARDIKGIDDLSAFGEMTPADLTGRPFTDFIPRRFHSRLDRFIVGQTGGTTGGGTWTAYREDEFREAFITPFAVAADHVRFPRGENWLYVGPTGPHVIGKAVPHLAAAMGSPDPFAVDFDSRWAKKLPADSFALQRYTQHVVDQAMAVIQNQRIGVLFTTPILLRHLAEAMTLHERRTILGVHYGGTPLSQQELERFQVETFPRAVHISGYGNTLFGCCLELATASGRPLDYYPHGARIHIDLVDDAGVQTAQRDVGTVRFTRLDESMLIIRMVERDRASRVPLPNGAPAGFELPGIRDPCSVPDGVSTAQQTQQGLY